MLTWIDRTPAIIEVLAKAKNALTGEEVANKLDLTRPEALAVLVKLYELGLATRQMVNNTYSYLINKKISAVEIARAAQLGLNINLIDKYFNISSKEKKIALDISTKAEKIKAISPDKRKPLVTKNRNYLDFPGSNEVIENLLLIFDASNESLIDYLEDLSKNDYKLKLLLAFHFQAEESLKKYIETHKKI